MATGTNLFTSHEARILAHTPNDANYFLLGNNQWVNWRKYIFGNKNNARDELTITDSSWAVVPNDGIDVFGLSFKDTSLSTDTGDWRAWLSSPSTGYTILNMRIDGDWTASTFHGALDGNATTATALTSNAGGTEQPIYFTGGKPAATSYALKATVNNGNSPYVAYYSGDREISSAKSTNSMIMPSHYYHNLYSDNPTTGTTVYVHYYNGGTTSTNTTANLRVKSGSSFKVLSFSGDGNCSW